MPTVLECVINVSEGRAAGVLAELDAAAGACLLDRHSDADHNRSVLTLAGPPVEVEAAARRLGRAVVETLDLAAHAGVHPRIGTLDVVPFVALHDTSDRPDRPDPAGHPDRPHQGRLHLVDGPPDPAILARDRFAAWAAAELGLPCFLYGPGHSTLPDLRRGAWSGRRPDTGPPAPHPRAGAAAVGARPVLVAYNLWVATVEDARAVARAIRRPGLRTLGLQVGSRAQVSCNLIDPWNLGPGAVYDLVAAHLPPGREVQGAELVGLIPRAVLEAEPEERWGELALGAGLTIEARLEGRASTGEVGLGPADRSGTGTNRVGTN